jgi:sugar/nucleoside kinase (ribokinase family)
MFQVICIGSASKDIFFPTGEGMFLHTPEDIEAQEKVAFEMGAKYQVEDRFEAVGGVAANMAQGLARLGVKAACYSCVGDDPIGDWIVEELEKENVDTSLIRRAAGSDSDLSAILVFTQNGERTIFFNRDANERLTVDPAEIRGAEWLAISALNGDWKRNLRTVLDLAREKRMRLAVNPGQRNIKDDARAVLEAVGQADVLLLNKDEAIELVMRFSPATEAELNSEYFLAKSLHDYGAKTVALTDGVRGAWGYEGKEMLHVPVLMQKAVDGTGSGDAFGSGFLAAWIKGFGLEKALRWGIVNGGNVVRFYGAREGLLREAEIEPLAGRVRTENVAAIVFFS